MGLLNCYVLVHSDQDQQLTGLLVVHEAELYVLLALEVGEVLLELLFWRDIEHHDEVPVFDRFASFLREELLAVFSQQAR